MKRPNPSTGAPSRPFLPGKPRQCSSFGLFCQRGFTLLEILIVIVIIGITAAVASANLFTSDDERLQQESERLLSLLQRARDEAVFGGRVIGVAFVAGRVEFLERDLTDASRWQATPLPDLHIRTLPESMRAQVRVGAAAGARAPGGGDAMNSPGTPIVFLPVGIAAPFDLTLSSPSASRRITGDAIGNLTLTRDPA